MLAISAVRARINFLSPVSILAMLFLCHLWIGWPGYLSSDSMTQYQQAIQGMYDDHHPPVMSFVWRYLDHIYPGPGLMLLLNLLLLYSGVYFLINSCKSVSCKYLLLVTPIIPVILSYSTCIWKDIVFAFSFLLVHSYLAFITVYKKKLSVFNLGLLLIILFYGTAVKFQAQYLVIFPLFWLAYILNTYKIGYKSIGIFIILALSFYYVLIKVNNILVPKAQKSLSWQYVKIYDLAAISLDSSQDLLPDFIKLPGYNYEKMQQRFHRVSVDPLVFGDATKNQAAILGKTHDEKEQLLLKKIWWHAIIAHPVLYLKHRAMNFGYVAFSRVLFSHVTTALNKLIAIDNLIYKYAYAVISGVCYLLLAHAFYIALALIYLILAIYALYKYKLREAREAMPLLFFNLTAIGMCVLLFFFSMAGAPRYTYIVVCMVNASHYFAYRCVATCWGAKRLY